MYKSFEQLNSNSLKERLQKLSKDSLIKYILYLKEQRAFTREDRLKLQILDGVTFTIWACDENFKIVLWEGACEEVYRVSKEEILGKNYLEEFVEPIEREQSRDDCEHIIKTGHPQTFRLCEDTNKRGHSVQVITQCCRILDDDKSALQAEMAIHIDYQKLLRESEEFKNLEKERMIEKEERRQELLKACCECLSRLNETTEKRMNYFSNQRDDNEITYPSAINAMKEIIRIRMDYIEYFQKIKNEIKNNFDKTYPDSENFQNTFLNKEIDYAHELASVLLQSRQEIKTYV